MAEKEVKIKVNVMSDSIAELKDKLKDLNAQLENTHSKTSFTNLQKSIKETEKDLSKLTGTAKESGLSFGKLAGAIGIATGAAELAMKALEGVVDFLKEGVKGALEEERALTKMKFAFEGTTGGFERMVRFKEQMFKTTLFGKQEINEVITMGAELGRTETQTKKMVQTAMGLSRVTGQDLKTVMIQLNGTFEGTIGRLGRLEGSLKNLTAEQLAAGEGLDVLSKKFSKLASEGLETTEGKITQAKKSWSEFGELIGNKITPILGALADKFLEFSGDMGAAIRNQERLIEAHKKVFAVGAFGVGLTKEQLKAQIELDEVTLKGLKDKQHFEKKAEEIQAIRDKIAAMKEEMKINLATEAENNKKPVKPKEEKDPQIEIDKQFNDQISKTTKHYDNLIKLADAKGEDLSKLQEEKYNKLKAIHKKFNKDSENLDIEYQTQTIKNLTDLLDKMVAETEKENEKIKNIKKKTNDLNNNADLTNLKLAVDNKQKEVDRIQGLYDKGLMNEKTYTAQIKTALANRNIMIDEETKKKLDIIDQEMKEEGLTNEEDLKILLDGTVEGKRLYDLKLAQLRDYMAKKAEIQAGGQTAKESGGDAGSTKNEKSDEEKLADYEDAAVGAAENLAQNVIGSIFDSMRNQVEKDLQKTLDNIDKMTTKAQENLGKLNQKRFISDAEYQRRKEKLDKEKTEKETAAKKEAAKKEKKYAEEQALIAAFLGAVMALASGSKEDPAYGIIMAAIVLAAGLADVAIIAAKPLEYKKGGIVPSYASGGVTSPFGDPTGIPAILHPNEGVLNASAMSLVGAGTVNALNAGQVPQSSTQLHPDSINAIVTGLNNKKTYVVESDITTVQSRTSVLQSRSTF